jgi:hypothetical protein
MPVVTWPEAFAGCCGTRLSTKDFDEPLAAFIKRKGGINKCAGRFARLGGRHGLVSPIGG